MSRRGLLALAVGLLATGCGGMTPDTASEDLAKAAYRHLVRREDAALDAMLIPAARKPGNAGVYDTLRTLIPPGEPGPPKRINWQAYAGTSGRRVTYQHVYDYGARAVTVTTILVAPVGGGDWKVQAFNVNVSVGQGAGALTPS